MKKGGIIIAGLFIIDSLFNIAHTQTITQDSYVIQSGSKIWFEGNSTLNKFDCEANYVDGYGYHESDSSSYTKPLIETDHNSTRIYVSISARNFDCGKKKINKGINKTFKRKNQPIIWYRLDEFEIISSPDTVGGWFQIKAWGDLSISGKANTFNTFIKIKKLTDAQIQIIGSHPFSMDDYGISPPTKLWGLVKVKDRLVLHFNLIVSIDNNERVNKLSQIMPDN